MPNAIQAISPAGTRALLDDGTVIDQTGALVGKLPALTAGGMPSSNNAHWMADDKHVCATFSNEPVAPFVTPPPKGQPNAPTPLAEPYTKPDADHSVTLKVFGLEGSVRTVAVLIAAAAILGAFATRTARHPTPIVEPALLRRRSFALGVR